MTVVQLEKPAIDVEEVRTSNDTLEDIKLKLDSISRMFHILRRKSEAKKRLENHAENKIEEVLNKDGIPSDTCYLGYRLDSECPYILVVNERGEYYIGSKSFATLSEAAEFVTGVKTDGWEFWQNVEGDTLKKLYR